MPYAVPQTLFNLTVVRNGYPDRRFKNVDNAVVDHGTLTLTTTEGEVRIFAEGQWHEVTGVEVK